MSRTLIIGATSAIAEATERLLAARGDALYLVGRNETMLAAIAADLVVRGCPRIATESLDANDLAAHEAMLERAEGFLGGIDTALLAYGTLPDQGRSERSVELTVRELHTNAISVVALLTRLANRMEQRRDGYRADRFHSTVMEADAVSENPWSPIHSNSNFPLSVATVKKLMNGLAAIAGNRSARKISTPL